MSGFRFENNGYLYLLLAIPVLAVLFIILFRGKKKALRQYGEWDIIKQLMPDLSFFRPVFKFILLLLALASVIIALARPQFGSRLEEVKRKGIELMIALDVSYSMYAQDIEPTRLDRSKNAISRLVDGLNNDKIGLIVFAGDAYMQVPLTTDYVAVKMFLSGISPEMVSRQGTAIGSAINLAMRVFSPGNEVNKAIIVISDGENHEDDAVAMAKEASSKGVRVFTLGMGLPMGVPIPVNPYSPAKTYRKDRDGNVVVTKLDELTLQKIAATGDGKYVGATNTKTGLDILFNEINKIEKKEYETKVYADYDDRFTYFAAIALILLIIDLLILERKNKYLKHINLFKT